MAQDRFAELEALVAVVRHGSITTAAAHLGSAKSMISRRLRELETRLGVQLLTRTTRRIALTEAGERYVERAESVLGALNEADADASCASGALRGRLRAAVPLSFGIRHLSPVIARFRDDHPEVSLDLDFSDRRVDLVQDGFDIALRIANLKDSSLVARRLTVIRHALVASPEYLRRHGRPTSPDELAGHRCLQYSAAAEAGWPYHDASGKAGKVRVESRLQSNNGEFMMQMAEAGLGITMQPTFILYEALRDGRLLRLMPEYRWRELKAWAVYPPTRFLPSRVRAFIDLLAGAFDAEQPYWDAPS